PAKGAPPVAVLAITAGMDPAMVPANSAAFPPNVAASGIWGRKNPRLKDCNARYRNRSAGDKSARGSRFLARLRSYGVRARLGSIPNSWRISLGILTSRFQPNH